LESDLSDRSSKTFDSDDEDQHLVLNDPNIFSGQYFEKNPGQYLERDPGQYHEVNPGQYIEENPGKLKTLEKKLCFAFLIKLVLDFRAIL